MPRSITWLHVSDLHLCDPLTGYDAGLILESLIQDIRAVQTEHGLRPDLIFFTGDAAQGHRDDRPGWNLADQFREAHEFFERLRTAVEPEVPRENLFLIPGNHDVNREAVTDPLQLWLENHATEAEITDMLRTRDRAWQHYMERLDDYRRFLQTYRYHHLLDDPDRLVYTAIRSIQGVHVGIAGLNSAWACGADGERGRLWLGAGWQIPTLASRLVRSDFAVALVHHPQAWFRKEDSQAFFFNLRQSFRFCLVGHEHESWVHAEWAGRFLTVAAGAAYQGSAYENGYNFLRIDLEADAIEVWLRRFNRQTGTWGSNPLPPETDGAGTWYIHPLQWLKEIRNRDAGAMLVSPRGAPVRSVPHGPRFAGEPPTGREEFLAQLRGRLHRGSVVVLYGPPGVGKTALAACLAGDAEMSHRFPDGILQADVGREPSLLAQLGSWLEELGVSAHEISSLTTIEARARTVRDAVGWRRMLVLLDDVWQVDAARALHVGGPDCGYLVTTRSLTVAAHFGEDSVAAVTELSQRDRLKLLIRWFPAVAHVAEEDLQKFLAEIGGLPLAVLLVASYLRQAPAHSPGAIRKRMLEYLEFLHQLQQAGTSRELGEYGRVPISLLAAIEAGTREPGKERDSLLSLAALPSKPASYAREAALAVSEASPAVLDTLISRGFLEDVPGGRLTMHPAIAYHARSVGVPESAYRRMVQYFIGYVEENCRDYGSLEQELRNLAAVSDAALRLDMDRELVRGVILLYPFMEARGLYASQRLQFLLPIAEKAARATGEPALLARTLLCRGRAAEKRGCYPEAERYLQESAALVGGDGGNRDEEVLCGVLATLGIVASNVGEYECAERYLREGLALASELGQERAVCTILLRLGQVSHNLGNFGASRAYLQQGLTLARDARDAEHLSGLLLSLGVSEFDQDQPLQARSYLLEALRSAREIGHREHLAGILHMLAATELALGDQAQTDQHLREGLALARQMDHRWYVSAIMTEMGALHRLRGEWDRALGALREALDISREIRSLDRKGFALLGLARLAQAKQRLRAARKLADRAEAVFREIQHFMADRVRAQGDERLRLDL